MSFKAIYELRSIASWSTELQTKNAINQWIKDHIQQANCSVEIGRFKDKNHEKHALEHAKHVLCEVIAKQAAITPTLDDELRVVMSVLYIKNQDSF